MIPIGLKDLFAIFLKAGLAFGGGLGILAVLEDEFVTKRQAMSREEFLTAYGLGRIVPSGTMSALAAAFGYRFGGVPGSIIALGAMILPALTLSVILSAAYVALSNSPILTLLPLTILPAAVAFIVAAALRLGRDMAFPSVEALLAAAAFVGAFVFNLSPALLLLTGGFAGVVVLAFTDRQEIEG